MTDKEMAKQFADDINGFEPTCSLLSAKDKSHAYRLGRYEGFLAGLEAGKEIEKEYVKNNAFTSMKEQGLLPFGKWHKVFESEPYCYEYWDLPQDRLPKNGNFYFVKLKNGFVKICELKYDPWCKKKSFYDLHGGKQSNVVEWLDYPTIEGE